MAESTAERIWHAALGQLEIHVTRSNFDTWLKDTTGLRVDGDTFVVGVHSEFIKEWLSTRMGSVVCETVGGILGQPIRVEFEIAGSNGHSNGHGVPNTNGHRPTTLPLEKAPASQRAISSPATPHRLNPRYTFASFVVAESNRLAFAAANAAVESPGEDYNPLFIYSQPGLGKTHLLQAIAQRAEELQRDAIYITSEQFTNEFVSAIAQGRPDEFRRRFRSVQLLLVDDIQFLGSKNRTQEEFFYTFNDLHSDGCQVVVTADRPPSTLPGFEGRLSSRFQWGLVADIQPPSEETRLAILSAKAIEQRVKLAPDVAHILARKATDNVRELEGLLNRVVAHARLTNEPISPDLAARALAALSPASPCPGDPQAILQAVSSYFGVPVAAITGKSRAKPIAEARHVAMYLLREDADLALKQVGLILGHRDHSTIIHGVQKITRSIAADARAGAQLADIRSSFSR